MAACSQQVEPLGQHLGGSLALGPNEHQQHGESLRKDCGLLLSMSHGLSLGQRDRGPQPLALDSTNKHHQAGNYNSASPLPVDGGLSPLSGALAYFSAAGTPSFGSNVHNNQFLPHDYDLILNRRDSLELLPPDHPFFSFAFSPTAAQLPLYSPYNQADAHATVLPLHEQPISSCNGNNGNNRSAIAAAIAATQPAVNGPGSCIPDCLPPGGQLVGALPVQPGGDLQPSQAPPADQGATFRQPYSATWPRKVAPFQLVRSLEVHTALADMNAAIQQRETAGAPGDCPCLLPAIPHSKPAVCAAAVEGGPSTQTGVARAHPTRASGTGPNKRSRKR